MFHQRRILVVDDDLTSEPIWTYVVNRVDSKARLDWATSEPEAEAKIKKAALDRDPYDLIIADIFLSGSKTGLDLWRRFGRGMGDRFIVISAVDKEKLNRYLEKENDVPLFIKKPLNVDECIAAVSYALKLDRDGTPARELFNYEG